MAKEEAFDVGELALDVAGLRPELGSNVPERRLGKTLFRRVVRKDKETEAHRRAREMARRLEVEAVDALQVEALEALKRRGRASQAYELACDMPGEPAPFDVDQALRRAMARGAVTHHGHGRTALWALARRSA